MSCKSDTPDAGVLQLSACAVSKVYYVCTCMTQVELQTTSTEGAVDPDVPLLHTIVLSDRTIFSRYDRRKTAEACTQ